MSHFPRVLLTQRDYPHYEIVSLLVDSISSFDGRNQQQPPTTPPPPPHNSPTTRPQPPTTPPTTQTKIQATRQRTVSGAPRAHNAEAGGRPGQKNPKRARGHLGLSFTRVPFLGCFNRPPNGHHPILEGSINQVRYCSGYLTQGLLLFISSKTCCTDVLLSAPNQIQKGIP